MSANVIFVIVGIALILLALGISVCVFVLPTLMPSLLRLKPCPPLRSDVLASIAEKTGWRQISGPPFWKFVGLFLAVVCVSLLGNSLFEIIISYREHTESLIRIQREQAEGAAEKIGLFIKEIESQMGWTTQLPWSASTIEQRRFDGLRLIGGL